MFGKFINLFKENVSHQKYFQRDGDHNSQTQLSNALLVAEAWPVMGAQGFLGCSRCMSLMHQPVYHHC